MSKSAKRKLVGQIGVDSGHIELGDCGDVQLRVPTKLGDGIFPVYLSADGCRITIDTTPCRPSNELAWCRQCAKTRAEMRRDVETRRG